MKDGAASFLTKPVQEDQFIATVNKLIGEAAGGPAAKAAVAVMQ
jgi:FixJ family two-component response regulator